MNGPEHMDYTNSFRKKLRRIILIFRGEYAEYSYLLGDATFEILADMHERCSAFSDDPFSRSKSTQKYFLLW